MRRIARTCATLAAAGAMALTLHGPAMAAEGVLVVNGTEHLDPSGCIDSGRPVIILENHTDQLARVHLLPNCQGPILEIVPPGSDYGGRGSSVAID